MWTAPHEPVGYAGVVIAADRLGLYWSALNVPPRIES
jgi:hypothetical protein